MTIMSSSDPLVGHVLDGRYEILSRLARGGMATVYRAHDRRLTRTVAVKVMHDGLGDDAEFARKFDREARCAATLSNPHVVSVFDQGVDDGRPYIVMEFVTGCTLRHIITREAPIPPLRALEMMESVASALSSAHEAGLVHRDVKPENVLISERGQVKVADFGLARDVTAATVAERSWRQREQLRRLRAGLGHEIKVWTLPHRVTAEPLGPRELGALATELAP